MNTNACRATLWRHIQPSRCNLPFLCLVQLALITPASTALGQGTVIFQNTPTTLVSTNGIAAGWGIGPTATNVGGFVYALFTAPSSITSVSAQDLVCGVWTFTGLYATNVAASSGGRFGSPIPVAAINGWPPEQTNSFTILGWSTSAGQTWEQIAPQLVGAVLHDGVWIGPNFTNSGAEWFGLSGVSFGSPGGGVHAVPAFRLFGRAPTYEGTPLTNGFELYLSFLPVPATLRGSPLSQTAYVGATVDFTVDAFGVPPLYSLWFDSGMNLLSCATNSSCFELTNVQFSQSGSYVVIVTNCLGAATSAPVMLNVLAPVAQRPVPGIKVTGDVGSSLNIDYTDTLKPSPPWTALGQLSLTNTSQFFFDASTPLPPQRFYRAWQTGAPAVPSSLSPPVSVPAITLSGNSGDSLRVDYINQFGPTDAWVTLDTVLLTNTTQLYFDTSSLGQPSRLYRLVPMH